MRGLAGLALLPLAAAVPKNISSCEAKYSYDYIVVGGGTSGLVVANRLSELENTTVLVIEAGDSVYNNPNVTNANGYGLAFGTDIDYAFQTTNQTYAGGLKQTMRAAKALGGTSTINGLAYTRAEDVQVDAWEALGNKGWNWKNLLPYYRKSERLQIPTAAEAGAHLVYDAQFHGFQGPLKVGWASSQTTDLIGPTLNETYRNLDTPVPYNEDVNGGKMVGFAIFPRTVDSELNIREDAARAYYFPYRNRTNLDVMLNAHVNRITWKKGAKATADGVEITTANGTTGVVKATREVILSAGALRSPVLLELSGIGNPSILSKYNIKTKVALPTVGENLQDQMNNGLVNTALKNLTGSPAYVTYPSVSQVFGNSTSSVAARILKELPAYAAQVASVNGNRTRAGDLERFFKIQWDLIFRSQVPIAEVLISPYNGAFDTEYWALLPFSRGSIHISSADPAAPATINPNYFMLDWDTTSQVELARFIRTVFKTEPFADAAGAEIKPGLSTVAANASTEQWANWLKTGYRSNFHPVATAAMMPQEIGGVVDTSLKVYGTSNVRVVDASVLPFQVCGHLVSTLYAVAERAADIIKSEL